MISSTFPGRFTQSELLHLDDRYKAYLVHEAGAVHRQEMARLAQAVGAGMSDKSGYNAFIASLELYESRAVIKEDKTLMDKVISRLRGRR